MIAALQRKTLKDKLQKFVKSENKHIFEGEIVFMDNRFVYVDVNFKNCYIVPRAELHESQLVLNSKVQVFAEQTDRKLASHKKALDAVLRLKMEQLRDSNAVLKGVVTNKVNGGYFIDLQIEGVDFPVKAFLPNSQVSFVNQNVELKPNDEVEVIIYGGKFLKNKNYFVASIKERIKLDIIELNKKATEIKKGLLLKGVVKNITKYGAFVVLGEGDGLLHKADVCWHEIENLSDYMRFGQEITVEVKDVVVEEDGSQKISLSTKFAHKNEFPNFKVGQTIKCLKPKFDESKDGFVCLSENLYKVFIPSSELDWNNSSPQKFVQVLQQKPDFDVLIEAIDEENMLLIGTIRKVKGDVVGLAVQEQKEKGFLDVKLVEKDIPNRRLRFMFRDCLLFTVEGKSVGFLGDEELLSLIEQDKLSKVVVTNFEKRIASLLELKEEGVSISPEGRKTLEQIEHSNNKVFQFEFLRELEDACFCKLANSDLHCCISHKEMPSKRATTFEAALVEVSSTGLSLVVSAKKLENIRSKLEKKPDKNKLSESNSASIAEMLGNKENGFDRKQ